jgi:hypothetical protein
VCGWQFSQIRANVILWVTMKIYESRYTHDVSLCLSHANWERAGGFETAEPILV